jgi:hypothetical protein
VPLATALCKTFLLRMLNDSCADETKLRVVVPIEEEEKELLSSVGTEVEAFRSISAIFSFVVL